MHYISHYSVKIYYISSMLNVYYLMYLVYLKKVKIPVYVVKKMY